MVLLVGATGRLGSRIARELLSKGTGVRALCRPSSGYAALQRLGAEIVFGDLRDAASLDAACVGIDTVVTTANTARRSGDDTVDAVDLQGTTDLIDAARKAGVRHFIFMSVLRRVDEKSPVPLWRRRGRTRRYLRASGMTWTIVAPNLFMESWATQIVAAAGAGRRSRDHRRRRAHATHVCRGARCRAVRRGGGEQPRGAPTGAWRSAGLRRCHGATWLRHTRRSLGRAIDVQFRQPGTRGRQAGRWPCSRCWPRWITSTATSTPAALAPEFGVQQTPLEAWVRASLATARPDV